MTLGNRVGAKIADLGEELFKLGYGTFVVETSKELTGKNVELLGETIKEYKIAVGEKEICMTEGEKVWLDKLFPVFPHKTIEKVENYIWTPYEKKEIIVCKNKIAKPRVLVPAFPGTNCEYDSARVFEKAGAEANILLFEI